MKPIDLRGDFDSYLLDHKRIIPKSHLHSVCRFQNGPKTCRYIFMYKNKYLCVKNTTLKDMLDKLTKEEKTTAAGDNCEGLGKLKIKVKNANKD